MPNRNIRQKPVVRRAKAHGQIRRLICHDYLRFRDVVFGQCSSSGLGTTPSVMLFGQFDQPSH